jgi:hypothetical protein
MAIPRTEHGWREQLTDWKLTARRLAAIHFDGLAGAAATATEQ